MVGSYAGLVSEGLLTVTSTGMGVGVGNEMTADPPPPPPPPPLLLPATELLPLTRATGGAESLTTAEATWAVG